VLPSRDGTAYGMCRDRLAQLCRECDVYFNLSNINWIPELEQCRCRVLVDTDGVHPDRWLRARWAVFPIPRSVHLW